jgi:hypothetical protein
LRAIQLKVLPASDIPGRPSGHSIWSFSWHFDALLLSIAAECTTIERLTLAAAAVRRSTTCSIGAATAADRRSFCTSYPKWRGRAELAAAATFASVHEHRRLMQKGVLVDLLDEEVCHVAREMKPHAQSRGSTNAR